MIALSDVIAFLVSLMGDEAKRAEFDEDPQGSLQAAGLGGLTGQDVRDAELEMRDSGMLRDGGSGGGGGSSRPQSDDPVREIQHTTTHYQVTEIAPQIIQIDDRDTIFNDSFNSDDDITVIDDSFNDSSSVENDVIAIQDNDTVVNDNDVLNDNDVVSDDDTVVVEGGPEPDGTGTPLLGIRTQDITGEEPEPVQDEPEPVQDAAEPEPEAADEEPVEAADEPEPDPVDAAIV